MHNYLSRGITALAIVLGAYAGSQITIETLTCRFSAPVISETRISTTLSRADLANFLTVWSRPPSEEVVSEVGGNYNLSISPALNGVAAPPSFWLSGFAKSTPNGVIGAALSSPSQPIVFVPIVTTDLDAVAGHQRLQGPYGTVYESQPKLNSSSSATLPATTLVAETTAEPGTTAVTETTVATETQPMEPASANEFGYTVDDTIAASLETPKSDAVSAQTPAGKARHTDGNLIILAAILAAGSVLLSRTKRAELRKSASLLGAAWAMGFLCNTLVLPPAICLLFAGLLAGIFLVGKEDKLLLSPTRLSGANIGVSVGTLGVAAATAVMSPAPFSAFTLAGPICLYHCARSQNLKFSPRSLRAMSLASILACVGLIQFLLTVTLTAIPNSVVSTLAVGETTLVVLLLVAGVQFLKRRVREEESLGPHPMMSNPLMQRLLQPLRNCFSKTTRSEATFFGSVGLCSIIIMGIAFAHGGLGDLVAGCINWSVQDANLPMLYAKQITAAMKLATFCLLWVPLLPRILRIGAMAASFTERASRHGHPMHHAAMSIKEQTTGFVIRDKAPFIKAVGQTLILYSSCYAAIFAIWSMISQDCVRHGHVATIAPSIAQTLFESSHAAAIGAYLLAIMSVTWLPRFAPAEVVVSNHGLLITKGFLTSLRLRPYRSWNDISSVSIDGQNKSKSILVRFASGGNLKLRLSQLADANLSKLLIAIDEHAPHCKFSDEINRLLSVIQSENAQGAEQLHRIDEEAGSISSTTFSTLADGFTFDDRDLRVVRLIESRSFCATYLVRADQDLAVLKQIVSAKKMVAEPATDLDALEQQMLQLANLDHPNLAKMVACFRSNDQLFQLTEHIKGISLHEVVEKQGKLSGETLKDIARQLGKMLCYLHSQPQPIVHGALTPESFILKSDGQVTLIDLGVIDRFLEELTGTVIGDASFASPESIRGCPTQQSDIYSYGAIMFLLSTGRAPTALKQCQMQSFDKNISTDLAELIVRCTAFNHEERPSSFAEILEALGPDSNEHQVIPANVDQFAAKESHKQPIAEASLQEARERGSEPDRSLEKDKVTGSNVGQKADSERLTLDVKEKELSVS